MKLMLPSSGQEIRFGVKHGTEMVLKDVTDSTDFAADKLRGTRVWVNIDGQEFVARSICRPPDGFSKTSGRKYAANRLLAKLRNNRLMDKLDRRTVFLSICPEYDTKERSSRQRERDRREFLRLKAMFEPAEVKG